MVHIRSKAGISARQASPRWATCAVGSSDTRFASPRDAVFWTAIIRCGATVTAYRTATVSRSIYDIRNRGGVISIPVSAWANRISI